MKNHILIINSFAPKIKMLTKHRLALKLLNSISSEQILQNSINELIKYKYQLIKYKQNRICLLCQ